MEAAERENNAREALGLQISPEDATENLGDARGDGDDAVSPLHANSTRESSTAAEVATMAEDRLATLKRSVESKVGFAWLVRRAVTTVGGMRV